MLKGTCFIFLKQLHKLKANAHNLFTEFFDTRSQHRQIQDGEGQDSIPSK